MTEQDYKDYRKMRLDKIKAERKVEVYQTIAGGIIVLILIIVTLLIGGITYPY